MIVILGGSGYIGQALQESLRRSGLAFDVVSRRTMDYTDGRNLLRFLREHRPEFLINAAGHVGQPNIDACENDKFDCLHANSTLPGMIRRCCEHAGVPWGHVSSGCIYTGSNSDGSGFTEQDPPNFTFRQNNCSFYSGCKALAEELLANAHQCYIWRPRMPFSHRASPRNYLSKVLSYERLLDARNSLSDLDEFADACIASWHNHIPYGVYNLTNPGSITTREVVALIQKHKLTNKQFQFFDSEKHFLQVAVQAPRSNCILDSTKAIRAGLKLTDVNTALERELRNWRNDA